MEQFKEWDDDNLNLKPSLLRGIYNYGYDTPSYIQKIAIQPILSKQDVIAQAQSGTGKTGTYLISALQTVNEKDPDSQVLIILPTRELAKQTHKVCLELSKFMRVTSKLLIGGTSVHDDIDHIRSYCPQIIIGCTGRIYDLLKRRAIYGNSIKMLILDEADEMLSFGFKRHIQTIFGYLHRDVQVILLSATIPPELDAITRKFMRNPKKLLVEAEKLSLQGIEQFKITIPHENEKYEYLKDILEKISLTQCIIYCNSVKRVQDLYNMMKKDNYPVTYIHSNMTSKETSFHDFVSGKQKILISSDITARGIDIQQVSLVINMDIPSNKHTYLHRIGRSGRWGRKGTAINFVSKRDSSYIEEIESWYKIKMMDYM